MFLILSVVVFKFKLTNSLISLHSLISSFVFVSHLQFTCRYFGNSYDLHECNPVSDCLFQAQTSAVADGGSLLPGSSHEETRQTGVSRHE